MNYLSSSTKSRFFSCALIWIGVFLIMAIIIGVLTPLIQNHDLSKRTLGLWMASIQNILLFITPTIIAVRAISIHPFSTLELTISPSWLSLLGIVIVYIVGMPFLNQIIYWNANISLPESLSNFESYAKAMEQQGQDITAALLDTTSFGGMITGILIIGIMTGIGEELVFRGMIQRAFGIIIERKWVSIWLTAIIFSLVHFQFYGFVPRLLLSAFYGYLLVWTKNLWVPIIAHSINNSIVVVTGWIDKCNYVSNINLETIGVFDHGISISVIISFLLLVLLFSQRNRLFFPRQNFKR